MTGPSPLQVDLMVRALAALEERDYAPYLELRRLIRERPGGYEKEFRRIFQSYFALNSGGLTDAFKDLYFERLFAFDGRLNVDPYTPLLLEFYRIPRRQGDHALLGSFVSKLVAIHDDSKPIFDRHIGAFFGLMPPSCGGIEFRIAGFVAHLRFLEATYLGWSRDSIFRELLASLIDRHPRVRGLSPVRLADLLVWTVGRRGLGRETVK